VWLPREVRQLMRDKMPAALALRIQPPWIDSDLYAVSGGGSTEVCQTRINHERNASKRDLECVF
jgi:hypothetical protein